MKRRIRMLSLVAAMALVEGAIAGAQAGVRGEVYDVNFGLTNAWPICAVYGLPQVDTSLVSVNVLDYSVDVDATGKITGFAEVQFSAEGGTAVIMATVSGKMGMKGNAPVANMTFKGTGYSSWGSAVGKSSGKLKFAGTPVYLGETDSYYGEYQMDGKVNANLSTGIKGVKTINIKNVSGTIDAYDVTGMTQINSCILSMVAVNNKLTLGGCLRPGDGNLDFHYEWNGKGSANQNGKFNFTLSGTDGMKGATIKVKGTAVDAATLDTAANVNLNAMTASGKVMGQKVSAAGNGYLSVQSGE